VAQTENYLAIDLGAESGRAMLGSFDGERLSLEEVHRFPNPGIRVLGSLHWDVLRLFEEMKTGLGQAAARKPASLGVDTWGVDFALLDRNGGLVANPFHYRDSRTNGMMAQVLDIVPKKEIFEHSGLQFMEINTLFQLFSMKGATALDSAATFLMMPDLFHYWFTGRKACEFTDATTTQFFDPRNKAWATGLLAKLGLPVDIYPEIVPPGTVWGDLTGAVAEECGVDRLTVVAPACHDTGSAVAAVPASGADWAFLSSGTWSLLGVEVPQPYVNDIVLERNFTNEGGVWGTTRLLKNICGMWLLEECRRDWARQGIETNYGKLLAAAQKQPAFRSLFNVNDPSFVAPCGMPARIAELCRRTGQAVPQSPGGFVRAIFESLALAYRLVIDDVKAITGRRARTLHIVGGGSQNEVVCQYAADATGMQVVAGPVEATSLGNVLLQAMAMGRVADGSQAREIVRRSFEPRKYEPGQDRAAWQDAAGRLKDLMPASL
jgi:rhamnulokinase